MKIRKSASNSSEEVPIKNLRVRRPSTKEVVYLKIYESQYPHMLRPERKKKLLKQVQWSIVRMKRAKPMPPKNFDITYKYTSETGDKVEVTVPINQGGPWRFYGVPGVQIPEVTQLTPYHTTPLHAIEDQVPKAPVPGYRRQISPTFPAWQLPKFPSDA